MFLNSFHLPVPKIKRWWYTRPTKYPEKKNDDRSYNELLCDDMGEQGFVKTTTFHQPVNCFYYTVCLCLCHTDFIHNVNMILGQINVATCIYVTNTWKKNPIIQQSKMLGTFLRSIKEAYVDDMIRFVRPSIPTIPSIICMCVWCWWYLQKIRLLQINFINGCIVINPKQTFIYRETDRKSQSQKNGYFDIFCVLNLISPKMVKTEKDV